MGPAMLHLPHLDPGQRAFRGDWPGITFRAAVDRAILLLESPRNACFPSDRMRVIGGLPSCLPPLLQLEWPMSGKAPCPISLFIEAEPVLLAVDANGVYRIADTRVTLDTLVAAYQEGATAEEMADQYPSLKHDHIYAVIGYCLRHREEVAASRSRRAAMAAEVRCHTRETWRPTGVNWCRSMTTTTSFKPRPKTSP